MLLEALLQGLDVCQVHVTSRALLLGSRHDWLLGLDARRLLRLHGRKAKKLGCLCSALGEIEHVCAGNTI